MFLPLQLGVITELDKIFKFGIPDQVMSSSTPVQIVHQIFDKLDITNLENDILNIRTIQNRRKSSGSHQSIASHSFILKLNYLAHAAKFELLVAEIKPHIIAVVETWLNPDIAITLDNYTIFRRDRGLIDKTGRYIRGGGVACFIHNSIKSKVLYISKVNQLNNPEFILLDVTLPSGSHVFVSSIYRRPQGDLLNEFFTEFGKLYPHFNNIIILGDLNCNLLKTDRAPAHLNSFITDSDLFNVPFGSTYHTSGTDSWLDVIIIDSQDKLGAFSKSQSPFIGGHDYLSCEYRLSLPSKFTKTVCFRDFRHCDHQALAEVLTTNLIQTSLIHQTSDPNELLNYFMHSVTDSLDNIAPHRERILKRQVSPWITKELKAELHARDALYKQARRSRDLHLLTIYRIKRRELKSKLNNARENYFKNILEDDSQGVNIWTKLRQLGIIKSKQSSPLDYFDAERLNSFYAKTLTRHPSCTREFIIDLPIHYVVNVDCRFNWSHIDFLDVIKSLKQTLQKSKGKSPDGLDLKWLRDHLSQITLFLTTIFNSSLNTSLFPDSWKSVFIIPLNKVKSPKSMSDTRPIANLPHLAKAFERIVAKQVVNYLEENNLLDQYQSGFRKTIALKLLY
ncbi:uncharacterized protein LOC141527590 [Cotesia typhae]|uniref:uncharacterized protein LOC141527590 n=1 Tax=Cotesia typhae TaxID=2053667 RepID=UPI003D698A8A